MDNTAYIQEIRNTVDEFVTPHNPDAAELLYDALTGRRPAGDMLTAFESVGLVCLDSIRASAYRDRSVEFIFMWRIDRATMVSCNLKFPIPPSPETSLDLNGYTGDPEKDDEWWRVGHAKAQAYDSEQAYRRHKWVIGKLYTGAPDGAKIVEGESYG